MTRLILTLSDPLSILLSVDSKVREYLSSLGKKGGAALKKKDPEHFKKISKLGHEARWGKKPTQ